MSRQLAPFPLRLRFESCIGRHHVCPRASTSVVFRLQLAWRNASRVLQVLSRASDALAQPGPGLRDALSTLFEHRFEQMPHVHHVRPDPQEDVVPWNSRPERHQPLSVLPVHHRPENRSKMSCQRPTHCLHASVHRTAEQCRKPWTGPGRCLLPVTWS